MSLTRIEGTKVCQRCALRRHLDRLIPPDPTGPLTALRAPILLAEPLTTRRWLIRAQDLLAGLHHGHIRLEHAVLDALPQRKAVEHLRALLISTEILPPDHGRALRWLESRIPNLLAELSEEHHQITSRWIRWAVLPRMRRLLDSGRELTVAARNERRKIDQVVAFLLLLQADDRTLAACAQDDIDSWFAEPGAIRARLRPFLAWAQRTRQIGARLILPPSYRGKPTPPLDPEERWAIARRLITDIDLDPDDRVAGALIVLYAQPLDRIVTLTTTDVQVTTNGVHLWLGTDPLELPEPLATLIQTLPHQRRNSTAQHLPNQWLFASSGHAGRHLDAVVLSQRMRAIGIQPSRTRLAAADQLCREIPPAMLAGVLGLHTASVARVTAQTSGQWANYIIDRHPR